MLISKQQLVGGIISAGVGLALLFWLIPNWVEPDDDLRLPVSLVPQILAIGFLSCGLVAVFAAVFTVQKNDNWQGSGFERGELIGFIAMVMLLVVATIGFQFMHFMIVAPLLVAISMWMFCNVKLVSLVLTSTLGPLSIWFVTTELLGRVLP